MVNAEIGKKILSYDTVIKKYENVYQKNLLELENCYSNNSNNNGINIQYIFLLLLIIIFILFILKSK